MYVSKERGKRRGFLIPADIIVEAGKQGIGPEQLQHMVMHSTRITHPSANRRFNGYLFMVEGKRVVAFGKLQDIPVEDVKPVGHVAHASVDDELFRCKHCKDKGRISAFNECAVCEGIGCNKCDEGLVPTSIPCPMCAGQPAKKRVDKVS